MSIVKWARDQLSGGARAPAAEEPETIDSLTRQSQELGRQVDELRERRRALKQRIEALVALREARAAGDPRRVSIRG